MKLYFVLVNKRGIPLNSFHSNGGWEIKDVFPCSWKCHTIFESAIEAQEYLEYIINECWNQKDRWGDWAETAIEYAHKFRVQGVWHNV